MNFKILFLFLIAFYMLGSPKLSAQDLTETVVNDIHQIVGVRWDYDPYEGQDLWSRQVFLDDGTEWIFDENCFPAHTLIIHEGDSVEVLSEGDKNYSLIFNSHYEMVLGKDRKTWEMIYISEPKIIKFIRYDNVFWLR